ncbi:MAG: cytochrome b N-terminal domain-containing protein [Caldisericia bacterium]
MSRRDAYSLKNPFNFLINGFLGIADVLKAGFSSINIFNHLGSLTLLFFIIQIISGFLLSFFYMPSIEHARNSVLYIMSDMVPYGLFIRTLHRYAADAMIIFAVLHLLRKLFAGRHTSTRSVGWYVGIGLLLMTIGITVSGYILPMDARSFKIVEFFGMSISSASLLVIYRAVHIGLPILVFAGLIWHFVRISRPPIVPTIALTIISLGFLAIIIALFPIPEAEMKMKFAKYSFDWVGLWMIKLPSQNIAQIVWVGIVGLLVALPLIGKKITKAAKVDPARCNGCFTCITLCPKNAISKKTYKINRTETKQVAYVTPRRCQACGICVAGCLPQVIELEGMESKGLLQGMRDICISQ